MIPKSNPALANGPEVLRVISYFATSLYNKRSVDEVLWDITHNCIERLGLVDCVIYLMDKKRQVLVQRAAYGNKNPTDDIIYNRIEIPVGSGIVGTVAATGKSELINDVSKDDRYIVDDAARSSELAVPIMLGEELIGVIDSEHPDVGFFTSFHKDIFLILAALCAQGIQNVQQPRKKLCASNSYYQTLLQLMEEKVYLDPNLSLQTLADKINISPTYLSYLINDISTMNFCDFVNSYRVREARQNLSDPAFQHYSIVSVGLEAGFNSKSTFFTAFKKFTGQTPSHFRQ